ncbi:MAG TPA: outer membrane beta-barrel protein [Burkholderiales bacterium]|nr:outer membrane beta-barrel protein [Burkholderiales bacterium]
MSSVTNRLFRNVLVGLALASGTVSLAFAQSGVYLGASIGQSKFSDSCKDEAGVILSSCDNKDTGFKLFGGYMFNPNLGVEVGYVNLGEITASGTFLGTPFTAAIETTGFTAHAVGVLPLNEQFSLLGKLGLIRWDADASVSAGGVSGSVSEDGIDFALALGAQYNISRSLGVRAEWDFYKDLGNNETGEDDVHLLSVGIVFSF